MASGDHIKVTRLGYSHHGIDVGNNRVIHFTGEPGHKSDAQIQNTSQNEFLDGGKLQVVEYSMQFDPEEVVKRAVSRDGEIGYNLIFNNCEHFATWCVIGEEDSEQVRKAASITGGAFAGRIATSGAVATISTAGSVSGLSASGIMSGLAATGPGGVLGGIVTLSAIPAVATNIAISKALKDDEHLTDQERSARKTGRIAAKAGTIAGAAGSVGAISAAGSVSGLSAAGISSGLASLGGGSMIVGTTAAVAAPAVAALVVGFGAYKLWNMLKS